MIRLKELRQQNGLTIRQVADLLCVSQFSIIRWEKGVTSPNAEKLKKLADLLQVTPNELLGVDGKTELVSR
ncbi:MAG: helix-turn-helix transcriptional regulator [Pyramidobacter porci]|uniref:helix-turn-helix domain-containing protein n=1 Tax=Pyramidobacter porci TaxID=2605789 RepID=UPI002A763250|nr:helix-turn-helix transcriptional regulator [Pyramidobacter porci]MDY2647881.1 helix-turn-helix transcriptional regulator [Pyramidobacter porci]